MRIWIERRRQREINESRNTIIILNYLDFNLDTTRNRKTERSKH